MKKEYKEKKKGTNEVKLRKKRTISGTRSGTRSGKKKKEKSEGNENNGEILKDENI